MAEGGVNKSYFTLIFVRVPKVLALVLRALALSNVCGGSCCEGRLFVS